MGSGLRRSELKKFEDRAYNQLKEKIYITEYAGGIFKCPFCAEMKHRGFKYDDLLQHAEDGGKGSKTMSLKQQAQHIALSSYLRKYCSPKAPSMSSKKVSSQGRMPKSFGEQETHVGKAEDERLALSLKGAVENVTVTPEEGEIVVEAENYDTHPRKMQRSPVEQGPYEKQDKGKKFVFPWTGVIKNVPVEGGNKLKENLIEQGFKALKVTPIWSRKGFSGCCLVDFGNDWPGFSNAMKFEKAFELERRGKKDWTDWYRARCRGDTLFGWVASEEDFHSFDPVGKHLQKLDLKSINDVEAEEERKTRSLVSQLHSTIVANDLQYKVMESKLQAASISMNLAIKEADAIAEAHNKEMSEMCESQLEDTKRMLVEHRRIVERIEAQKKRLKLREKELDKREARNEHELRELSRKQKRNELAYKMQNKADMNMLRLAEKQKREKEALHRKANSLRKELDHKQALELKIEQLRGAMQVMKHMEEEDMETKEKMKKIAEELKDNEEELESQEDIKQTLIVKGNKINEELQEAREALINGLQSARSRGGRGPSIGVKVIGVLDSKPFEAEAQAKYSDDIALVKATEWWSLWEAYLKDCSWRPFKCITEKGIKKELIDEEDEKLKELRNEVGEEGYKAVVTALIELNEYNPLDRNPMPELWNFNENRRAKLSEGADYLVKQWAAWRKKK